MPIVDKDSWLESLSVGQILKGRILRHYDESRYGVQFAGQERVVDSAVPLSVGDVISGKVIGISESLVSLQIVRNAPPSSANNPEKPLTQTVGVEANPSALHALMKQAGLELEQSQLKLIASVAAGSERPESVFKAGLYLAKLGLPLNAELVRILSKRLMESPETVTSGAKGNIPELISQPAELIRSVAEQDEGSTTALLAQFFSEYRHNIQAAVEKELEASKAAASAEENARPSNGNNGTSDRGDNPEAHRLLFLVLSQILNRQTGAAYQHRFETLPIIIDGRVTEFDLALFDHSANEQNENRVRARHLKFSLKTEMGIVAIDAHVFNDRIRVHFNTDADWAAKEFELYQDDLELALGNAGWTLDAAEYRSDTGFISPAARVVEHVLAQDSLRITM